MGVLDPIRLFEAVAGAFGTPTPVAVAVCSVLFSSVLYLASGLLSRILVPTYRTLALRDQHRWNSGINRAGNGIALAYFGLRTLYEGCPAEGVVWGSSDYLVNAASYALGFFIFEIRDSLNMYLAHGIVEETLLLHHAIGFALYLTTLSTRAYLFLACVVLIQEIIAPFVHLGWILTKCGMVDHPVWEVNQILLIVIWIVFRHGNDVMLWYYLITNLFHGLLGGPFLPMTLCLVGTVILTVFLNPWWCKKKIQQLMLRNSRRRKRLKRAAQQHKQQQEQPQEQPPHPAQSAEVSGAAAPEEELLPKMD